MTWTYDKPLVMSSGPKTLSIASVKHGVTQVSLSDGRIVRLSIHVEGVKENPTAGVDVSFSVVTEVMAEPELPIMDQHEGLQ